MKIVDSTSKAREIRSQILSIYDLISNQPPEKRGQLLKEAENQLDALMEELLVAEEELKEQNQELKDARYALESERLWYQGLYELSPDGYLVTNPLGEIIKANLAAAHLLDISHSKLEKKLLVSFIQIQDRRSFRNLINQLQQDLKDYQDNPENKAGKNDHLKCILPRHELEVQIKPMHGEPANVWMVVAADFNGEHPVLFWSMRDVTGYKQAEQERLILLRRLFSAQEDLSQRISRELHDHTGQSITAMILALKSLEKKLDPESLATVQMLRSMAEKIGHEIHDLALVLRPTALDDLGLVPTLENHAAEWSLQNQISVDFQAVLPNDLNLTPETRITIYRVVQEALNNISKHAGAKHVSLIIENMPGYLATIIEDDGSGFDIDAALEKSRSNGRLGLISMRERAQLVGGRLSMESAPGKGTTIFLRIPIISTGA